ncbi:MAG: hypothetical protein K2K68_01495 [Duncaniella sp.]|nr:hypothetical protein [Duncaniella sp.]
MNRLIKLILIFIAYGLSLSATAQRQVAVYVSGDQEEAIKKVLGSKMVTYITNTDGFTAIERTVDFLNAMQAEQDYQTSGEVSNTQIVKLGQQFGARYVAVVDVSELFGELFVSARLIDVQTATIESSFESSSQATSMSALTDLANKVADGLILGPKRKAEAKAREERERKAAEEQARINKQRLAEENRRAQLRAQAINNLMPANAINVNGKIMINKVFPAQFSIGEDNKVKVEYNLPPGFTVADATFLSQLANQNILRYMPKGYYVVVDWQPHPISDYSKFKYGSMEGDWYISSYFKLETSDNVSSLRNRSRMVTTKKRGGRLQIEVSRDVYAIAVRDFFTESEIQAEMNRISSRY